jgi:hypothetical protein
VALIEFSKRLQELKNKNTEEEERKIINRKKKKKNTKQNNTKFWAENIEVMSYIYTSSQNNPSSACTRRQRMMRYFREIHGTFRQHFHGKYEIFLE